MNALPNEGYHESTVCDLYLNDNTLTLVLDGVNVNNKKEKIILNLKNVKKIEIEGEESNNIEMETDDGEILTLEVKEDSLSAIIEWNDFSNHTSIIKAYLIIGDKVVTTLNEE